MTAADDPVRQYARLLLRQHELDPLGDKDSPALDALCEAMDDPWTRMTGQQRQRMKGLSEDLYALAEGRHGVLMQEEERLRWAREGESTFQAGDPDRQLEYLRRLYPADVPLGVLLFLQAQAWSQLGLPEVAILFFQESGKSLPAVLLPWLARSA